MFELDGDDRPECAWHPGVSAECVGPDDDGNEDVYACRVCCDHAYEGCELLDIE